MASTTYNITPGRYSKDLPVTTKVHFKSSTNSYNGTSLKNSPGTVFNLIIHNTHNGGGGGSAITFRLYNKTTAPIVGTDVPMIILHYLPLLSQYITAFIPKLTKWIAV
jgi:hypothetical protein